MLRWTASLIVLSTAVGAQDRPSAEEELRAKLAAPFLRKAAWVTDYDEARASARERGALVFGYFTTAGY